MFVFGGGSFLEWSGVLFSLAEEQRLSREEERNNDVVTKRTGLFTSFKWQLEVLDR